MAALEQWQAITSQNIAASSMRGYKKINASFETVLADSIKSDGSASLRGKSQGSMPVVKTSTSFEQGEIQPTNGELDFAIQGKGFFKIQRENGEFGYTRDGEFHIGPDRKLITKQGLPVLGESGPIVLTPGAGKLSLNKEGFLVQGTQVLDKLAVEDIQDPSQLRRLGDVMFEPPASGPQMERVDKPGLVHGYLEQSNVSPLTEMVQLISISRAHEAAQKTIIGDGDTTEKAIQVLGNPQA